MSLITLSYKYFFFNYPIPDTLFIIMFFYPFVNNRFLICCNLRLKIKIFVYIIFQFLEVFTDFTFCIAHTDLLYKKILECIFVPWYACICICKVIKMSSPFHFRKSYVQYYCQTSRVLYENWICLNKSNWSRHSLVDYLYAIAECALFFKRFHTLII